MLKFILILILIILVLRFFARLLMPFMLGHLVKKAEQNMYSRMKQNPTKPEGHIDIDYVQSNQKKKTRATNTNDGEFIDFEEIK